PHRRRGKYDRNTALAAIRDGGGLHNQPAALALDAALARPGGRSQLHARRLPKSGRGPIHPRALDQKSREVTTGTISKSAAGPGLQRFLIRRFHDLETPAARSVHPTRMISDALR